MSNCDNSALLTWLDSAIAETSDLAERAVIMHLAENATGQRISAVPKIVIEDPLDRVSGPEIGRAVYRLHKRGWIHRGWMLTFPREYQAREAA